MVAERERDDQNKRVRCPPRLHITVGGSMVGDYDCAQRDNSSISSVDTKIEFSQPPTELFDVPSTQMTPTSTQSQHTEETDEETSQEEDTEDLSMYDYPEPRTKARRNDLMSDPFAVFDHLKILRLQFQ
jgi:hypothetical protein